MLHYIIKLVVIKKKKEEKKTTLDGKKILFQRIFTFNPEKKFVIYNHVR